MSYFYIKTEGLSHKREVVNYLKGEGVECFGCLEMCCNQDHQDEIVVVFDGEEGKYSTTFDYSFVESYMDPSKELWYNKGKLYGNKDFGSEVNWECVPDWAEYAAKDADGNIYLYDSVPFISSFGDIWIYEGTMYDYDKSKSLGIGWKDSLEKRPDSVHKEVIKDPKTYRDLLLLQLNGKVVQRIEFFSDDWLDLKVPIFVNLARLDEEFDSNSFRVKG